MINFDQLTGDGDNAKIRALNDQAKAWATKGGAMPTVVLSRRITITEPIKLRSSLAIVADAGVPAREFGRRPGIHWAGPAGSSMLTWLGEAQINQGYPSDGSPRDGAFVGLEFTGRPDTHWMPPNNPGDYKGKTLWLYTFRDCGWKNFRTVWHGAADAVSFAGISHFQGIQDTALWLGGSECTLFGGDGHSFADTQTLSGTPFLRSSLSKSYVGKIMVTARKSNYGLLVDGGHNTHYACQVDAQDSDPIHGAGVKITGGEGHVFQGMSLKGIGSQAQGRGWIEVTGGRQHVIEGNSFHRGGTAKAPTDYPVVYAGGTAEQIKVGLNGFSGWGGAQAIMREDRANRFASFPADRTVRYVVG